MKEVIVAYFIVLFLYLTLIWLGTGTSKGGPFDRGNGTSGSIKCGEVIELRLRFLRSNQLRWDSTNPVFANVR
jgi:hypothetical protein